MQKYNTDITDTIGYPPGTLIYVGEKRDEKVTINVFDYTESEFSEHNIENIEDCFKYKERHSVTWININGVHDIELLEKIGQIFDFHPLLTEDIANTEQRPKMDDYGKHIYFSCKMLYFDERHNIIEEHVSIIIGDNYVLSFQEQEGDVFNGIRDRIRNKKGRVRKMGSDYLAYALLDAVVDNYYLILETISEAIENVEDEVINAPKNETVKSIHKMKKNVLLIRKYIWPLRVVISDLQRIDSKLIKKTTGVYFKDVYDHAIQAIDTIENFRDMISGLLDVYLSGISHKMNSVIKVLTIISTIFIPLTFIAGVYGMNFKYMPELEWRYGYFAVLGVMFGVIGLMLWYFRRKDWI